MGCTYHQLAARWVDIQCYLVLGSMLIECAFRKCQSHADFQQAGFRPLLKRKTKVTVSGETGHRNSLPGRRGHGAGMDQSIYLMQPKIGARFFHQRSNLDSSYQLYQVHISKVAQNPIHLSSGLKTVTYTLPWMTYPKIPKASIHTHFIVQASRTFLGCQV